MLSIIKLVVQFVDCSHLAILDFSHAGHASPAKAPLSRGPVILTRATAVMWASPLLICQLVIFLVLRTVFLSVTFLVGFASTELSNIVVLLVDVFFLFICCRGCF